MIVSAVFKSRDQWATRVSLVGISYVIHINILFQQRLSMIYGSTSCDVCYRTLPRRITAEMAKSYTRRCVYGVEKLQNANPHAHVQNFNAVAETVAVVFRCFCVLLLNVFIVILQCFRISYSLRRWTYVPTNHTDI